MGFVSSKTNQRINKCIGYWKTKENYANELMGMWEQLAVCTKDNLTVIPEAKEKFADAIKNKDIMYIAHRFFIHYGNNVNINYRCRNLLIP